LQLLNYLNLNNKYTKVLINNNKINEYKKSNYSIQDVKWKLCARFCLMQCTKTVIYPLFRTGFEPIYYLPALFPPLFRPAILVQEDTRI